MRGLSRVCYFCDIDIYGLIWGRRLCFASAICLEILLLLTFTNNFCDDVCEARVWIYNDFTCFLAWPDVCVFEKTRLCVCVCVCVCVRVCVCVCVCL